MMPDQNEQELRSLFNQWMDGDGDETTIQRLSALAENKELTGIWQSLLSGIPEEADTEYVQHSAILDKVYQNIIDAEPELKQPAKISSIKTWLKYAAAAAAVLMVAGGYYFFNTNTERQDNNSLTNTSRETPVTPLNTNRAVLTLSSGEQIMLDSSGNGKLALQTGQRS